MWTQILLGREIWFLKHNLLLTASEQKRDNQEVNLGLQLQASGNVSSFHHNCLTLFPPMTNLHFFTGIETSLINAWWQELTLICLRGRRCLHTGPGYALFAFRCLPFVFSSEKFLSISFYWRKRCCLQQAGCNFAIAQGTAGVGNVYYLLLLPF